MKSIEKKIPNVTLPLKIDIIKHSREVDGKSTAVHAKVLSPDDVTIHTFPSFPDYDASDCVLVFPSDDAKCLEDIYLEGGNNCSRDDDEPVAKRSKKRIQKAVFIDSTWNQVKEIIRDDRLKNLARVRIPDKKTLFWRPQKGKPDTFLATIESIYYFVKEFSKVYRFNDEDTNLDDILYFFMFFCEQIKDKSSFSNLKA
ncbi:unnamed protein product [Dimorphilus gyrociliatus]|uniref:tRNA-uridine aminocarboxypropyltransferase 1 n=1 Tax=Dimorphilus gyrociliatus TaxID=2664684 RepID=A0A7I8VU47_9ANNE|nr:unnamed protein product [Dimorphilus gyrociliatus]